MRHETSRETEQQLDETTGRIVSALQRLRNAFKAEPTDTDYEYAYPLSTYRGDAAESSQALRAYQRLKYGKVVSPELLTDQDQTSEQI